MQIQDCDQALLAHEPIPQSGRFQNRRRPMSECVYRLLERARFVVPVSRLLPDSAREAVQRGGRSIKTTSEFSR